MIEHFGLFTKIDGKLVPIHIDENKSVEEVYNSLTDATKKFVTMMPKENVPENDEDAGRKRMSQYLKDCCCETGIRIQEETQNAQL